MKKLIALISAIAVMGSMSLTSLAAITATPAENATLAAVEGGYSAALTSAETNTQTTILAVKGAEITTSSIQYINQLTQDSEVAINFDLKDALAVGETVNVYMGGDAINKTLVGTIANVADPVEKFTVKFVSEGATLSEVAYDKDAAIVVPENPTKAADASYTYAFAGWYVEGDAEQTVVDLADAKATANVTYVAKFTATAIPPVGGDEYVLTFLNADGSTFATTTTVDGAVVLPETEPEKAKSGSKRYAFIGWYTDEALTTKIASATIASSQNIYPKFSQIGIYGDANADGSVKATDIVQLKRYLKDTAAYTGKANTAIADCQTAGGKVGLYGDANGDGSIKATDIVQLKRYLKDTAAYTGKAGTDMVMVKD